MKTIALCDFETNPQNHQLVRQTLEEGQLVCIPTPSGYKLIADLGSPAAITAMLQAKRRVKNAPALIFVPGGEWVEKVAQVVSDEARLLMGQFWPGPVTLLFKASDDIHPKVRKPLTKAKGWLGVRIPEDDVAAEVVKLFGRPVLVSSANLAKKKGAHSVAQVKKNFGRTVALMLDAGDLPQSPSSTLVDVSNGTVSVVRAGAVEEERIMGVLAG